MRAEYAFESWSGGLGGVHRDSLGNASQLPLPGATFSEFNVQLQIVGVTLDEGLIETILRESETALRPFVTVEGGGVGLVLCRHAGGQPDGTECKQAPPRCASTGRHRDSGRAGSGSEPSYTRRRGGQQRAGCAARVRRKMKNPASAVARH